MKKPVMPAKYSHLAFYIGQEIEHKKHGRGYFISGINTTSIECVRNLTGLPEDDELEMFDFEDVRLILFPCDKALVKRYADSLRFIKFKCAEGVWVFDQEEIGKSVIRKI
jgi:hypothetical protein